MYNALKYTNKPLTMESAESEIIEQTMHWLHDFVIRLNLCPFAKGPVNKKSLRLKVSMEKKKSQALEQLMAEVFLLDSNPAIETSLLVFAHAFKDFFTYLDFVDLAEQELKIQGYEGIYQLASFHPDYYFDDTDMDDASNLSNRSPYPMVHLLREELLEKAIAAYGDTEGIPERNKALLRGLVR